MKVPSAVRSRRHCRAARIYPNDDLHGVVAGRQTIEGLSGVDEVLRRREPGDQVATAPRGATIAVPAHLDAKVLRV
jgi:predicted oxidoreductase